MDVDAIRKTKKQINEVRRWFYLSAEKILGVDITGIPLPRVEPTVSGGFTETLRGASYEFMEPTEFDRSQAEEARAQLKNDAEPPKIYTEMGGFLHNAVKYLEAQENIATGETGINLPAHKRNLELALKSVEKAAERPPFSEAAPFVEEVLRQAQVAFVVATSDKPVTFEQAELRLVTSTVERR